MSLSRPPLPVQVLLGSRSMIAQAARSIAGAELLPPTEPPRCSGIVVLVLEEVADAVWQSVRQQRPDGRDVILVGGPSLRPRLADFFAEGAVRHLVLASGEVEEGALTFTVEKLRGGAPRQPPPEQRERVTLQKASQKGAAVEQAGRFARARGASARHCGAFCTVVEELITNAVYNAPVDAEGRARFARLARDVEVKLDAAESVEVELTWGDQQLGVSVTDRFGSLTAERVQESMARCLRKGADQIARAPGGAGIGLYYSWELLSRLTVEIQPQTRTRVTGVIDTRGSHREFVRRAKSFDVFVEGARP